MSPREAWKFGFLAAAAERGLDWDETAALVKRAVALEKAGLFGAIGDAFGAGSKAFDLGGKLVGLGTNMVTVPLAVGVVGSALAGAAGGTLAAKLRENDIDPEEIKRQELITAYNFQADEAARRAELERRRAGGALRPARSR